jgi:D-glycero-alpha-D-manno-heptose-7-phosphate kinase
MHAAGLFQLPDMTDLQKPLRMVNSAAPVRVCDNGGWADTWFAKYGKVFNIAVNPCVEVQLRLFPEARERERITIHAENYGQRYTIGLPNGCYHAHPLIEAVFDYMRIPDGHRVEVTIFSEVPGGCSTGTSAALTVALIGALDGLTPGRMSASETALAAQRVETQLLKQQCGIQDQIASAYGGISYIDMYEYPYANVFPVKVPDPVWWELEARLSLVFVGQTHSSSETHQMVIRNLEDAGPEAPALRPLRLTAEKSRDALLAGDFAALGQVMIENTEAQRNLHPDLIGPAHQKIIDVARESGAIGWKVNGAGGSGGSVTLLSASSRHAKREMLKQINSADPSFRRIPISLSACGLRVWDSALD